MLPGQVESPPSCQGPRPAILWFMPLVALTASACAGMPANSEQRWYLRAQARPTAEYCPITNAAYEPSSDCALLISYLGTLAETVSGNEVICVPVSRIRRNRGLWNALTPRFRKEIRNDHWIGIHRAEPSSLSRQIPSTQDGAPDCIFPAR